MKDPGPPRDAADLASLGARHDDSSLFSLESLRRTEEAAKNTRSREDSGLIDLKALAALERDAPPKPEMAMAPVIAPPDLFAVSAPITTTARPISIAPPSIAEPKPARTKLVVGVVGALVVAAAIGVFFVTKGGAEAAPPATVAAAAPTPPPTPTATATAVAAPEEPKVAAVTPGQRPPPPATATAAAPAVAAATPKTYGGSRPAKAAAAPKDDAAPAPPPKPVDTCDLACQMQRAVHKK